MKSRSFYSRWDRKRAIELSTAALWFAVWCVGALALPVRAFAGDAPAWMHAQASAQIPPHDGKTDAVEMYSERIVTVQSAGKIKTLVREAYKVIRPGGRDLGTVVIPFDATTRISNLHAWCIPAQGKDYEVKEKDSAEVAMPAVQGSELITDVRAKVVHIPAADPGNLIGYEYEQEDHPFVLQDIWYFQGAYPTRESHYTVQLPPGWEYKAYWLNHSEAAPKQSGSNQWQWVVSGVPGIKDETYMPPHRGVAGQVILSFVPPGGTPGTAFVSWRDMGLWYTELTRGRRDASPEIKQKVTALTASATTPMEKMRALARFVQRDIRYVAIELGIGGYQPHPAVDVFTHRYGDCKDKATLMAAMLKEIGIESYYVVINSERGSVTLEMPAHMGGFDHAILAIQLPAGVDDPSLVAVMQHPKVGRLLFFDPTDELTAFGKLSGPLQANYGLLVTPEGGELVELPQLATSSNGIARTAKLTLTPTGTLLGDIKEVRVGDRASAQRYALKSVTKDTDKIKPIETLLAGSLSSYRLTKASFSNLEQTELPFVFNYSVVADNYAKAAGNLLLVRPRVVGVKSSDLLETKEPRQYPVVFDGPSRDMDVFEITMPANYEVDDLPQPVSADFGFASYHSKAEVSGNVLRYARTFEVRDPNVPLAKMEDLKKLYRIIANDERNNAVLKPTVPASAKN
ncbi:MAG TPA: DUF3857 and transglutaminase domain-containing protein [Candidatus Saccharimonadales bacterium]|jgi:hypothetical protein|nr:DUF3857 and transglutaminase domain-containing protein [Candidatus Saccharimonadales bacterium]